MYIHLTRDDVDMTVGAVSLYQYSGNYNYDTTTQYKYFGMAVSDDRLQQLMVRYGILQTGDSKKDLEALYQAMYPNATSQATKAAQSGQQPQKPQTPQAAETTGTTASIPWSNLMGQVGLIATGELAIDIEAFKIKMNAMQVSATTPEQKASIGLLQAEAAIVFVQPSETTKTASAAVSQSQPPTLTRASGADIQAQLNKLLMVF